jgi:GNAT superfamily N-acetyltransferase
MNIRAHKVALAEIGYLRELFLEEANTQIRYNACHERGWSDSYLLSVDGITVGYGSVKGQAIADRDTVFEFYIVPASRNIISDLFRAVLDESGAQFVECQSNDALLFSLVFEFCVNIKSEVILFCDHVVTNLFVPGIVFRSILPEDELFEHRHEPEGNYGIIYDRETIATGGFLLHYNKPYADLYMEVREDFRKKGIGSYLIQEIKKQCYLHGRIPAARCSLDNPASRATLLKAGFKIAGFMIFGQLITHPQK